MSSTKVIAFFSAKGGVGKTTSCSNVAAALGKMNIKVLLIDMDPLGSLTNNFLKENLDGAINLLVERNDICKYIIKDVSNNVDMIPTTLDLSLKFINKDYDIYNAPYIKNLDKLKSLYDIILIDTCSGWNSLNKLVLGNCHSVLLPVLCRQFSIDSISKSLTIVRTVQSECNPKLKIEGTFVNMFDKRASDSMVFLGEILKIFKNDLYDTRIPQDSNIIKLQKENKIIVTSASWQPSAIAFCELSKEIYQKLKDVYE